MKGRWPLRALALLSVVLTGVGPTTAAHAAASVPQGPQLISLNPPLVLVCVAHDAHSYPALAAASHFAVNILAGHHETVSSRFATKPAAHPSEKFEGVDFRQSALGLPVLKDSLAELECATVNAYPAGDHTILVGRVEAAESRGDAGLEPLLYYRGKYRRLHDPALKPPVSTS